MDAEAIRVVLARYRQFEECILDGFRFVKYLTAVELEFSYIWDDDDPSGLRLADEARPVVLSLELVREVRFDADIPVGVLEDPDQASWGLAEVAAVRLKESSDLLMAHRLRGHRSLQHLAVEWETDQRIDVIFEFATCSE
jgi:hypothetical protein